MIEYDPMGAFYAYAVIGRQGLTVGGYGADNGAQGGWEGQIGGDAPLDAYGKLSVDAIAAFDKGAVPSAALSAAQNALSPGTLAATISDNKSVMLFGKWSFNQWRISGGYEAIKFQNPATPQTTTFTDIAGVTVVAADINNNAYAIARVEQVFWLGGR